MPELPEVENYCRYIKYTCLHTPVEQVTSPDDDIIIGGVNKLSDVVGQSFNDVKRHGKHIFVECSDHGFIRLHCGMTGRPYYYKRKQREKDIYPKIIFHLADGYYLAFHDPRKLGAVEWINEMDQWISEYDLGPDALKISPERFHELMKEKRGYLKSSLMDQGFIAGIGNVYSDEICFQTGLHPKTKIQHLTDDLIHDLYDQIQHILTTAIDAHAGITSNYYQNLPDHWMTPTRPRRTFHGDHDYDFEQITVGGRTGYFVPDQQSKPT